MTQLKVKLILSWAVRNLRIISCLPVVVQLRQLQGLLCSRRLGKATRSWSFLYTASWAWRAGCARKLMAGASYKLINYNCILYGMKCSTGHEWKTYEFFFYHLIRRQPDTCRPSWCHFRSVCTVFLRTVMKQEKWWQTCVLYFKIHKRNTWIELTQTRALDVKFCENKN